MNRVIRILVIPLLGLKYEGITSVIYNYCSNMDKSDMDISFLAGNEVPIELKKRFDKIGKIIQVPNRKKNLMRYIVALSKILDDNCYDIVHIHGNSGTMALEALLSKIYKVKNVVVHCHNTTCSYPILNRVLIPIMKKMSNHLIACSDTAGKWLYGHSKYIVLNNAIDLRHFQYNNSVRSECRLELNLTNEFVVGHVGHFTEQKNHEFLIDVFAEFHKYIPNSKLVLISDGPLLEGIINRVKSFGLDNAVMFLGRRSDVNRLYQAMDLFILPSLWEGLPVVVIEAQAAGLPLVVSSNVTKEAKCTKRTFYEDIVEGPECWAQKIVNIHQMNFNRESNIFEDMREGGFDIKFEAEKLRKIYLGEYINEDRGL